MSNPSFPAPIEKYFAAKAGGQIELVLECFTDGAVVWDNGEDKELRGTVEIRDWMSGTVASYKLTSEVRTVEQKGEEFVAAVIVSGDFPGSPYEFAYRFKLEGDLISELAIDPVGSLAP